MDFFGSMIRLLPVLSVVLLGATLIEPAQASDLKVEAILVWGTNEEKPSDPKLKPVDKETVKRLREIFVWKNYFEVRRTNSVIASRSSSKIRMSDECEVEVTELPGPAVEYGLIGQGKRVSSTKANFVKGESLVMAGGGKDRTAWFIVLTQVE